MRAATRLAVTLALFVAMGCATACKGKPDRDEVGCQKYCAKVRECAGSLAAIPAWAVMSRASADVCQDACRKGLSLPSSSKSRMAAVTRCAEMSASEMIFKGQRNAISSVGRDCATFVESHNCNFDPGRGE